MYNPNSAIERIKNHLAYKLGQAMIDFTNNGGGYIALFKKLYQIKRQHKKEQKIYQQTIQVFPQLKYPSLEACSDYEQALKYKFHLSYMLGEVLIKADKTWYKGGGFKLKNNIKKAKKEFQIFREIFKEFDQINSSILKGLIDNKQLFLKEFPRIKHILKIHQDYKAILDNIFHNFNYFIQNFDLIEEWLLLDGFKEKYKKENHPYPSLLDPKKLNDENEKINYKNIPAELAWEMNLPLPRNYRFIFITGGSCGHMAMFLYFKLLKINRNWTSETEKEKYKIAYNVFIASKEYNIFSCQWDKITQKLFYLVDFNVPLVVLLRDPIERLKSLTNHIVKHITKFDLTLNPN
ncbi:sugar transferase, partial [Campylobacter jejuni]|nr:sugar transferase [Campylobacter jejuni]